MSKRANGEGSVYQRQDGRWTAATYVLRSDGGRERRQVYGATRAAVIAKLQELITKTSQGIPAAGTSWTVETFAAHWLGTIAPGSLRPSTLANYAWIMRKHIAPAVGPIKLEKLTPAHVRQLHSKISATGVSARTVQLGHAVLRAMLSEAMREEYISRNVASLVRTPRVEASDVTPWTVEETATFLQLTTDEQHHELFALALALGLRRGELLGLRWEDIDLATRKLHVRQTAQRLGAAHGMVIGPPKSARSRRTIPLPDIAVQKLRSRQRSQRIERELAGESWQEKGLVFSTGIGTIIEPSNLRRSFDQAISVAGVRRIRFHDMRHTCASLLLARGVPLRVVMDVLGHSTMSITSDLYAHVMPSALVDAASAIDFALASTATDADPTP